jgi:hypothetical protein
LFLNEQGSASWSRTPRHREAPMESIVFLEDDCSVVSNIGGIVLDANVAEMFYPLFTNLSLPWAYIIPEQDYTTLLNHFQRHYPSELTEIFKRSYHFYSERHNERREIPLSVRLPFVRWYKDETYNYFGVFGLTFKTKRKCARERKKLKK